MKRATTVPPAVRTAFVVALKELSAHAGALPDPLPMGRVLRVFDRAINADEELRVLASTGEQGYYLDYYRVDNGGETSWHGRIRQDGALEPLENYEGQVSRRVFPDDPAKNEAELQRLIAHNTRVTEILRAKGFK